MLALYFKLIQNRGLHHEKFATVAGIGCSSRFPYFVQAHGAHYIHGRALPFATGIALSRQDLDVFVFGGDGDAFSIGGNHFNHCARKNVNLTYVVMDNNVYGLTKNKPPPPARSASKVRRICGAPWTSRSTRCSRPSRRGTFVARSTHTNPKHLLSMMEAAMDHKGFAFIECLSECTEFYDGAFDSSNPRKGGEFKEVPEDHDPTDENAAYALAEELVPGHFGIYYQIDRPSKQDIEAKINAKFLEKTKGMEDWEILQQNFDKMK